MSGGPPPHGQAVGVFKVTGKHPGPKELMTVMLLGDNGSCMFQLTAEDANYFVEGEQYLINATRPG